MCYGFPTCRKLNRSTNKRQVYFSSHITSHFTQVGLHSALQINFAGFITAQKKAIELPTLVKGIKKRDNLSAQQEYGSWASHHSQQLRIKLFMHFKFH